MVLTEIFFFFPPGLRRWQNLFHGKFQFLFPIWKRNRIISLRNNKKKASEGCSLPMGGRGAHPVPGSPSHLENGTAQPDLALGGEQTPSLILSPTTKLCQDPQTS